ncbi:sulfate transporter family-domain-containing protein [Cristinia sonorae]|uniref:Sulfate transporter family-domain-containing protein n=1 Tax=Cristinia sonorae TaxID=1940300 RepID=A0A8K0XTD5_9AGAR|nr:sulfate transporter family-domain-containing protein [Cristinia sonorae]
MTNSWRHRLSSVRGTDGFKRAPAEVVRALPAVLLGALLNVLDGISYGMIIFPAAGVFAGLGGVGVSMFFVSAVVSQLVYSAGGSGFAGANGSMMIEVVPFFHILAQSISAYIGEDRPEEVLATTMVAFAFSSLLTGATFLLLGALRLGSLIGFFPRHILVGCIGGVGIFLIITGLTVCTRITEDDFDLSFETFKFLVLNSYNLVLWLLPFFLAVLLRIITHRYHHQLIFPLYFIIIPIIFYIAVAIGGIDIGLLREKGWLFDMGTTDEPWYKFYTLFNLHLTNWGALWDTLPTQFALLFFNILHPPLNVPALAVSLNHDVDTDKELVAHGYSNILAGALGTVPNYLVYVNTLLFYRVGGVTRIAGFLLAGANVFLLVIGTGPIAYIPVMVVGALIFVLGIDLVKEALWDTRNRVNRWEYITIASIMICMTVWDFVIGVLFGIIMSCCFFVVQNSQRKSIRALHTGEAAMSTVRRPGAHRAYIREVSRQTTIVRLQGFLFFGTITHVEETIRTLLDGPALLHNPIRFLVLDLAMVVGVDMSAAEAFVRIQRILAMNRIVLVLCGFTVDSAVGKALKSVDLLEMDAVEVFTDFTEALEWTENAYLTAWFLSRKLEADAIALPGRRQTVDTDDLSMSATPRRSQLLEVGFRTIARDGYSDTPPEVQTPEEDREPLNTIFKAFSSYGPLDRETFRPLVRYLQPLSLPAGHVLWTQGDAPDGLYIVEGGILRAIYQFADHASPTYETMVPGTLAGELSMLSGLERNASCIVERDAKVWKLSVESLKRLQAEEPDLAREFTQLVLKSAKLDYDILLTALASRQ